MSLPTIKVELDDGTGDFSSAYDITDYVRLADGYSITRGRADEMSQVEASTLTLNLDNTDGRFTLGDTTLGAAIAIDQMIRVTHTIDDTDYVRFTGYVQTWPIAWTSGGEEYAVAQITATDLFARLARTTPMLAPIQQEMRNDDVIAYWPLTEDGYPARDLSGHGQPVLIGYGEDNPVQWKSGPVSSADGQAGLRITDQTNWLTTQTSSGMDMPLDEVDYDDGDDTAVLCVSFLLRTTNNDGSLIQLYDGTSTYAIGIGSSGHIRVVTQTGSVPGDTSTDMHGSVAVDDGTKHYVEWQFSADLSTNTLYVDGVEDSLTGTSSAIDPVALTRVTVGAEFIGTFGRLSAFRIGHLAIGQNTANAADRASVVLNGFLSDSSDERVQRYAEYAGVDDSDMDLETGVMTNTWVLDTGGMNALDAMQQVVLSEAGLLFVDGSGDLVMQNRTHRADKDGSPDATLSAAVFNPDTSLVADMQQIVNYVHASRPDKSGHIRKNATSITEHGLYSADYTLLCPTSDDVAAWAQWMVDNHAEPSARIAASTIDLMTASTATQTAVTALELSDLIEVTDWPTQAPGSTVDLTVEGWTETVSLTEWSWTVNTSPYDSSYPDSPGGGVDVTVTYTSRPYYAASDDGGVTVDYTSPEDFAAGDNDADTYADGTLDDTWSSPYGAIVTRTGNIDDAAQVVGSQTVPNADWTSRSEQRLYLTYTSADSGWSFEVSSGDGASLQIDDLTAAATPTTVSVTKDAGSFVEYGVSSFPTAPDTDPHIYEWWIETDVTYTSDNDWTD